MPPRLLGSRPGLRSACAWGPALALPPAHAALEGVRAWPPLGASGCAHVSLPPPGIMLGRMGDSGAPLVSFCQCLNESVMKIVAVAVW